MNILYTFGFTYPLSLWAKSGALEREFHYFNKMSEEYNLKFTLITYGDAADLEYVDNINITVIPMYTIFNKSRYKVITFIQSCIFPFKIYNKLKDIDLIKQNQLYGCWVAIILKFLIKKPLFIRTGFDAFTFSVKERKKIYKRIGFFILTQLGLLFSNIYSVSSKTDYSYISKKYLVNKSKLLYRPNWVLTNPYTNFNDKKETNTFLSIGRLVSQKNYPFLIKALSSMDFKLHIIGSGPEENRLLDLAKKEGVELEIFNNLSYFNLLKKINEYQFFVLPSLFEGNPKVLLEAMASGSVCFVSDIPNHRELIDDNIDGIIFDQQSVQSFRSSIKIASKNKKCMDISISAVSKIEEKFSINKAMVLEYEDYINLTKD